MGLNFTSVFKVHDAVMAVSSEAKKIVRTTRIVRSDKKLLGELLLCIISSQEKYEVALSITRELVSSNLLRKPTSAREFKLIQTQVRRVFSNPVKFTYRGKSHCRRLRFNNKKYSYVISALRAFHMDGLDIAKLIRRNSCARTTRLELIKCISGLGPKQASMYLRNIGYHNEFAVLDKHILDYMQLMGLITNHNGSVPNIRTYERLETLFKEYAEGYCVGIYHLDLAIWTTMRTFNTLPS